MQFQKQNDSKQRIYDWEWSVGVFQRFRDTTPRATDYFLTYMHITEKRVIFRISCNDKRWRLFKTCVKTVEKLVEGQRDRRWWYDSIPETAQGIIDGRIQQEIQKYLTYVYY